MKLTERFDTPEKKKHLLNRIALVPVAAALAVAEHYLDGRGACRVHGAGFAGTIQAFVPLDAR